MCAVSAMQDYFRANVPMQDWTRPLFSEYQEVIRRLEQLDIKLSQPDCEDPAKAEWMKAVEERLSTLERA